MELMQLHPPIVHFAVVLPIVALVFELLALVKKNKIYSDISTVTLIVTVFFVVAAFITGKAAGSEAYILLSKEGQEELLEHKALGTYLMIASIFMVILKIAVSKMNRKALNILFIAFLFVYVGATLKQGKDGGELVYEYAANVECPEDEDL
ncbi:DUF2231 domain-containing protein [Nitrosophilus alvini]|uniref:DUF2231 domain-containing protein n=1 Tax=Nitrosophilus alvini TaxID=2714855 RepID=UPI00190A83B6|nr:DUF2231 domain-containing protein [Nitrosophilus alvini]